MANQLSFSITARNAASTAMSALQRQVSSLKNGLSSLGNNSKATTAYLNSLNRSTLSANSAFGGLGRTVRNTIGIFGGFRIVNGIFNLLTSNMDRAIARADTMDLFSQKMTMITGVAESATQSLDALKTATKGTPYALDIAAKGVQNFVLRGMQAGEAVDSVKIWMDAVSAYGKGTNEQFESVMDAIAKMRTKGTVEMRYLNRLFAAGINPVQMYATATGQAAQDVQTALSNKDISANEFLNVVEKAMREGTNGVIKVQGKAKALATTWAATTANMGIAIARGLLEFVNGVDAFANFFNDNGLKGMIADFGTGMEDLMTGLGNGMKTAAGIMQKYEQQIDRSNTEYMNHIANHIATRMEDVKESFSSAGQSFIDSFGNTIAQYAPEIAEKATSLRVIWSDVRATFAQGIEQLSAPFAKFIGTYLGESITGVEDLGIALGKWLNLKLPVFFDDLEKALNWLTENKDIVISSATGILKALLAFKALQGVQSVIIGFNNKLKILNDTLAFFTMGKIQIPTLENLVLNEDQVTPKSKPSKTNKVRNTGMYDWMRNSYANKKRKVADSSFGVGVYNAYQGVKEKASDIKSKIFKPKATMGDYEIIEDQLPNIIKKSTEPSSSSLIKNISSNLPVTTPKENLPSLPKQMTTNVALTGAQEATQQTGLLSKSMDKLKGAFAGVGSGIKTVVGWISSFIATVGGIATAVVLATASIGALTAGLGMLNPGNAVSNGINKFFQSFSKWCTTFANNAPILIQSFVTGLIQNLPKLVSQGTNLLISLVNGILTGIPKLLTVGATVLFSFISGLLQVLPDLVYQGFSAVGQFVSGIISNLPSILSAAWELVQTIGKGILMNLPVIVVSAVKLIGSLISGIWSMLTQVGTAIKDMLVGAWNYLWEHPQEIWDSITGFVGGMVDALVSGLYAAADMIGAGWILDWMGLQRPEAANGGKDLAQEVVDNSNETLKNAGMDFSSLLQQVNSDDAKAQAQQVGTDLGNNITAGVDQSLQSSAESASDYGTQAGTNYIQGLENGVTTESANVDATVGNVGQAGIAQLNVNFSGEQVTTAANGLIDTLVSIINTRSLDVAMAMAGMANNAMIQLAASFAFLPEDIPNAISTAMTAVVETVNTNVQQICTNIQTNLTAAKDSADIATQQLSTAIQNNFLNATISVNASLEQMKTDVYARYEELRAGVTEKLGAIESTQIAFSTEHMNTFRNNIFEYIGYVESDYQGFVDNIKGKLDELVRASGQAGKDMMTEMQNGIASNMQKVIDKASELVQQLKKTFEEGLGIHSPSRYMFYIGQMLLAGLMGGLAPDKVQTFIDGVVGDMQGAFDNGKYQAPNADEAVDFLSDQGTLDLIGRVSKVDTKDMNPQQIAYPLIGTMGTISSPFGNRSSPGGIGSTNHAGMDIASPTGTPIASALAGTVTTAGWYGGYGNAVVVDSGNGLSIVYGHMSQVLSSVGQVVQKGQQIGLVGSTGNSTGPHLHFEMRNNGDPFDPAPYLGGAAVSGVGNTLAALLQMAYNKKHGIITGSNVMYNPSAGAAQWSSVVLQALAMLGQPASLLNYVLYAIERESSGNPNAINLTDSNAAAGHPSQGLLQTIPSTFAAYRNPNLSNSLTDPLANIYAGLNYMIQRYGGIEQVVVPRMNSPRGWYGYAVGTRYVPFDMPAIIHQGEAIIPASQNPYSNSGGDYLGDLIANAMNSSGLNSLGFDTSSMTDGGSTNNNTTNNNLNNVFNITNSSDVDSDRSISEMESMLHRMLQDGKRVGVPR